MGNIKGFTECEIDFTPTTNIKTISTVYFQELEAMFNYRYTYTYTSEYSRRGRRGRRDWE